MSTTDPSPPQPSRPPAAGDGDAHLLEGAWGGLERDLTRERTPFGRLRRAPTVVRMGLALTVAGAMPIAASLAMPMRNDLHEVSWLRAGALVAGSVALAAVAAIVASRPLQARALQARGILGLGALAAAFALGAAALPLGPLETDAAGHGVTQCGGLSLLVAVVVAAFAHTVRRGTSGAVVGAASLGVASAFVTLAAVCSVDELTHLLLGHAVPLVAVVAVAIAVFAWPKRSAEIAS